MSKKTKFSVVKVARSTGGHVYYRITQGNEFRVATFEEWENYREARRAYKGKLPKVRRVGRLPRGVIFAWEMLVNQPEDEADAAGVNP